MAMVLRKNNIGLLQELKFVVMTDTEEWEKEHLVTGIVSCNTRAFPKHI